MLHQTALIIHAGAVLGVLMSFVARELLLMLARGGRRQAARMALRASHAGTLLLKIAMLAGIVLVFVGGWRLSTPWLVACFALIAAAMAVGGRYVAPWEARAESALGSDASCAAINEFASEKTALFGRAAVISLFTVIAALMTMKPEFLVDALASRQCVDLLQQPFFANASVATAGGCLSSQYLTGWVIARLEGIEAAQSAIRYVAPVGEKDAYVARAMRNIRPFVESLRMS
jgi:hypothetical protein